MVPNAGVYSRKEKIYRFLLSFILTLVVAGSCWCSYHIYKDASIRITLKNDYAEVNNIQFGLLSVDRWRDNITELVNLQIEQFQLTREQEDTLRSVLNEMLNSLVTKTEASLNNKQHTARGKLMKFAAKNFVDVDKIRKHIPEYSQTIINQIKTPANLNKLKFLAEDKLLELSSKTHDSIIVQSDYERILAKYDARELSDFNSTIQKEAGIIQEKIYFNSFCLIGAVVLFLLIWRLIKNQKALHIPMFTFSVILALLILIVSLFAPMIEIDARIKEINFLLMDKNIRFYDQVIFFQSKSIMDVVTILITTGKADSIFVGLLLLVFSVLFPIIKLLSTKAYLLGNEKWKKSKLINFFAFQSGKWSMADVMVVAIFMAYIGFNGILDNQLEDLNMKTNSLTSIATNQTSLQPGFILFITYVLFGLILSVILKKITNFYQKPGFM